MCTFPCLHSSDWTGVLLQCVRVYFLHVDSALFEISTRTLAKEELATLETSLPFPSEA